jgi:Circadian oscillating protein COP23
MMKQQFFTSILGAIALSSIATITISDPSQAQTTTFYCGTSQNGIPTTFARTPRGNVEVIRWTSNRFSRAGYTPQRRCEEVSKRFQIFHSRGMLSFISAGYVNGLPAICAGESNLPCSSERLLFTLKRGQNAAREIEQLFNIRSGASGPLHESTNADSPTVVDMKQFLESAPVVESANANSPQPANTTPTLNVPSGSNNW